MLNGAVILKIRRLDLDDKVISQPHVALGLPPAEYDVTHASNPVSYTHLDVYKRQI